MRRVIIAVVIGLLAMAVGCMYTVREPGEPEHGGVFLHAASDPATRR